MKKIYMFIMLCTLTTLLLLFGKGAPPHSIGGTGANAAPLDEAGGKVKPIIAKDFGNIPLYFIPNKGQMDKRALFCAKAAGYTLWITKQGMVFDSVSVRRDVSEFIFVKAERDPKVVPLNPADHRVNYLKGKDRSQWRTGIPTSRTVCYKNLYKNIDLKVYGIEKQIEYDWVVKPGGNPADIRFQYQGIKKVSIDETGNLAVQSTFGRWIHKKPAAYQVIAGKKVIVKAAFEKQKAGKNTYGFNVAPYNGNYELIIDPMVIAFSTYLGGGNRDDINDMVIDGTGDIYITGYTRSSDFPTQSAYQSGLWGGSDAFVSKLSSDGKSLVFSTYLGGNDNESAEGIALDGSGNIYIGGWTSSLDFPTANPYQGTNAGYEDGFITALSPDGSTLIYSTYLGGNQYDYLNAVAVSGSGEICVTGETWSADFPLQNALQTNHTQSEVFVTKFTSSGAGLVFSTYLGGSDYDYSRGLSMDSSGAVYVAGTTSSTDFPTVNALQPTLGGGSGDMDGFVSKIASDGSFLAYSTYLGGVNIDEIYDLDVDAGGSVYVAGTTGSDDFPTTPGGFQETKPNGSSGYDAFITKLSSSGSGFIYSTFLGGSGGNSTARAITVISSGSAYVTGSTSSSGFPLVDAFQDTLDGWEYTTDVFITQLSSDGTAVNFSSYLGGYGSDLGKAIAVDSAGNIYAAGNAEDGFPAFHGFQNSPGDYNDGFIAKIVYSDIADITLTTPNGGEVWIVGSAEDITWTAPASIENVKIEYYSEYDFEWITITESTPNDGSYSWTIPDKPSFQCLVKVRDADWGNDQWDESDAYFTISYPPIQVISPNGGEDWQMGTLQDITWTDNGTITDISIDYSIDGGATWIPIAASIQNSRYYSWSVPNTTSSNCLVRVSDAGGSPADVSDNVFTISPSIDYEIEVMAPNGGENWPAGTYHTISWFSGDSVTEVSIDYSTDGGNTWIPIVASKPDVHEHYWTVPNTPSGNCLVRVSDVGGISSDVSDSTFTISPASSPFIAVISPNGGEKWFMGTQNEITWTYSGVIEYVTLKYSTDNGYTWYTIAGSTPNTGSYTWTLPNIPSTQYKVEVWNTFDSTISDKSDDVFTVQGSNIPASERDALIALYNSTNGDYWWHNENWRKPEDPYQFNDPGTEHSWYGITCNAEGTHVIEINLNGIYMYGNLPDLSDLTELKVLNLDYNQLGGEVPAWLNNLTNLTLINLSDCQLSGSIPDLGNLIQLEVLNLSLNGLSGSIPASLNNLTGLKRIELYLDGFTGPIPDLSNLSNLTYIDLNRNALTGPVPVWLNQLTGLTHLDLWSNELSGTIPDLSNLTQLADLSLNENQLTGDIPAWFNQLTSLEKLHLGNNQLTGTIPGLSNLTQLTELYLPNNQLTGAIPDLSNFPNLCMLNLANNRLSGNIPLEIGDLTVLSLLRLEGNKLAGPLPSAMSNLTNLMDYVGVNIKWNGFSTEDSVLIDFLDTKQLGGDWESTQTIAPTGLSTSQETQNSVKVSWTPIPYQDGTGGYNVYYSITSGSGYTLGGTVAGKSAAGYYVNGLEPGTTYYFVVETFTDPHTDNQNTVTSEYSMEVPGVTLEESSLTVAAPNGGESWEGGSNQNITWTGTGSISDVKIEYSTDNGTLWDVIVESTANTGTYSWTVHNTPSNNCLVRIGDTGGLAADTSDTVFNILEQRTVTMTAPNGGENWEAVTVQPITWTGTGSIADVMIEYSTDNGSSWNTITGSTANTGSYDWTIPNTPSSNCLVRISDTGGPASDTGDAVFTISIPTISSTQREALIALYNSTNGDSWTDNTNWRKPGEPTQFNDPGTEHTWFGITCNVNNTQVERIELSNNNLVGTIPVELDQFLYLNTLNLSSNQLSGTIPDLSNLAQLNYLYLNNNQLTGSMPAWLNTMVSLSTLDLGFNQLSGTIPDLSSLTNLTYLGLYNNQLTGDIPAWMNILTGLTVLRLSGNQLSGTIPDLSSLTNLIYLHLYTNQLTGSIPSWLNTLTNLQNLDLSSNQLSGGIPDLSSLTALTSLKLSNNQLTGSIPPGLGSLTVLEYLYLQKNQLNGNIPAELGNITTLKQLYLNGNQLIGDIPATLSNLTNLFNTGLNISWNGLYTEDTGLRDFLNSKSPEDWEITQTIAPGGLSTGEESYDSVKVSWLPIQYQGDTGGYRVYYSTTSGTGYTLAGTTADKTLDNYTVTGLNPSTVYYFVVETFTDSHADNQNTVISEYSTEISAVTLEEPSLTVTAPNGGENWEAVTVQPITWTGTGSIAGVMIEYSTDNGSSWNTITGSTANTGSYDWTIPNTPSSNCLVRISDTGGLATDTSDTVFNILEQRTVTVTAPNGGEDWDVDSLHNITWTTTGAVGNVAIDYSIDEGSSWTSIATSTANTGTYSWTVPDTPSPDCLVRINDTAGPASDTGDAVFTISVPTISSTQRETLIALYNNTNGDSWTDNTNWRKPGEPTQFNDPGTEHTWFGITCNVNNTQVERIELSNNNLVGTIPSQLDQLIYLKSLNLSRNQLSGAIPELSHLAQLNYLYLNNNQLTGGIPAWLNTMVSLSTLDLGFNQLSGTIPDLSSLTNLAYLGLYNNQLTGDIPAWMNILTGLTVLRLSGNQLSGTIPDLSSLTNLIYLHLYTNQLTGSIPSWLNTLTNLQNLDLSSNQLSGGIPDLSSLTALTSLRLSYNLLTGSIPSGLGNLTGLEYLYLQKNQLNGNIPAELGNITTLKQLYLNGNQLIGDIPATLSNLTNLFNTGLNISWNGLYTEDTGLRDFLNSKSPEDWEITQTIAPGGLSTGEESHDSVKVSWLPIQYQGDTGGYRVYYSTTSGTGYTLAGTTADKTLDNYTVTGLNPSTAYYFVVETVTEPNVNNQNTVTSEYSTEISAVTLEEPSLTVTAPNGGENWEAGTTQTITWTYTGIIADVDIDYSSNNGASWISIAGSATNTGSYNWIIPALDSGTCLVRVSDAAGPASDASNAVFSIWQQPSITVTSPNGGEVWTSGSTQTITWTSTGSVGNVEIKYSKNNGKTWKMVVDTTPNTGGYLWTLPVESSSQCLVQISALSGSAGDTSDNVFTILKY